MTISINESDLIERFKQGDPSAFEAIVRKHQDRIYNLCRYMLQDPRNAQDAAQDVFLKAYRALKHFRPDFSIYTWLYRIAVNTCLDYQKKFRREVSRSEPLAEDLPSDEPFPEQLYESREITAAIQLALQKLPKKLSAAIVLREIEGLSYKEIADVLHTSVGTVKSRISRAREELRHLLQTKI
ncbi:MAG: sigma-70 family RNA polymerase sigma factor [Desulfobacterales bacterium]|jgi:RNA polymerase sigma-70 factor (ECF subfamily)